MAAVPAPRIRAAALAAALVGCLGAAGCGSGRDADVAQIRQAIERFSSSSGAGSCSYLTPVAKQELYIGHGQPTKTPPAVSDAACRARSASFHAAPAVVTRVWFIGPHAAKAYAHRPHTRLAYTVSLRQRGGRWLINLVQH